MHKLIRIGLLTLTLAALATTASAEVQQTALVGPLNKSASGRILCEATLRFGPSSQGIILTIYDKSGMQVATQAFGPVDLQDIVSIEVGPGTANSYICIAQTSSTEGVEVTLSHRNNLNQSTATVGEPRRVPQRSWTSVAGPLSPGLQRKFVCKVAAQNADTLELIITDENGTIVASQRIAVNAMGIAEISINAGYNKRYTCAGVADEGDTKIQATAESRDNFGNPVDADEGSPQQPNTD